MQHHNSCVESHKACKNAQFLPDEPTEKEVAEHNLKHLLLNGVNFA